MYNNYNYKYKFKLYNIILVIILIAGWDPNQGVRLAVAHSPMSIGNFGGQLECISMVAHRAIGYKIDNIMVVRLFSVALNTISIVQLR